MYFLSTRGGNERVTASNAIINGIASDGGLYVPESFPEISESEISLMCDMDYARRAAYILNKFFGEFDEEFLLEACTKAYSRFEMDDPAPLIAISEDEYVLELYHGPTYAFKDVALTLLPYLMRESLKLNGRDEKVLIVSATSGDTGKAALESFKDAEGFKINIFYPDSGVSEMQKLQMQTQEGKNVNVVAVKGNFDDCQTAVKKFMKDNASLETLKENGYIVSSANSINIGRLAPQIVYYFSAYCDLVNSDEIKIGEPVVFSVPTGNFGNILSCRYAQLMGLPVKKIICASNANRVLTDFFETGVYDKMRPLVKTDSPSMDILVSSNLERFLFEACGRNGEKIRELMAKLDTDGKYTFEGLKFVTQDFYWGSASDDDGLDCIAYYFDEFGYVFDTHTAVAVVVGNDYYEDTKDATPIVYVSTASPYKFPVAVYDAVAEKKVSDPFEAVRLLNEETGMSIPEGIANLRSKKIRFTRVINKDEAFKTILEFIREKQE